MSTNNEPYILHREGATLYVLNKSGTNAFTMNTQAGFDDNGERLSNDVLEAFAEKLRVCMGIYVDNRNFIKGN